MGAALGNTAPTHLLPYVLDLPLAGCPKSQIVTWAPGNRGHTQCTHRQPPGPARGWHGGGRSKDGWRDWLASGKGNEMPTKEYFQKLTSSRVVRKMPSGFQEGCWVLTRATSTIPPLGGSTCVRQPAACEVGPESLVSKPSDGLLCARYYSRHRDVAVTKE